jgi:DNA-directed RNA polymerase I, II, and III subunit RPABC1
MENEQYDSFFINIYRCWETCKTMIIDRGYEIPKQFELAKQNEFYNLYQNKDPETGFNNYDIPGTNGKNKILVKYLIDTDTIKIDKIKTARNNVDNSEKYGLDTKIIYILKHKPNQNVIKEIKTPPVDEDLKRDYVDEVFYYDELIINRVYHRLVPKHTLITDAEKRELLGTYDIKDTQLPRILITDFVSRYYGAKIGDIFRIQRPSPSTGVTIAYRIVK